MGEAATRRGSARTSVHQGLSEEASQRSKKKFGSLVEEGRLKEWEEG